MSGSQQTVLSCHNCMLECDENGNCTTKDLHEPSDARECQICKRNPKVENPIIDNYHDLTALLDVIERNQNFGWWREKNGTIKFR